MTTSRDGSEYPFLRKAIFSGRQTTTNGSSFVSQEKKLFEKKIVANSAIGF